ncbi:MAG: 4Fe-4S dicluster domain-containing protein [Candidatus Eremiobacterota bacterium]
MIILRDDLIGLLQELERRGYQLVGPTLREGAIVYDRMTGRDPLPEGWVDEQAAGSYRLRKADRPALFDYTLGPASAKRFLHPPEASMWRVTKQNGSLRFDSQPEVRRQALIGLRACDLAAIAVQDRVLLETDPIYRRHRQGMFVLAVQCGRAGGTCFCLSQGTGPHAEQGFDLALTELSPGTKFYVEVGSDTGREVLATLRARPASADDARQAREIWETTAHSMGRELDNRGLKEALYAALEHPRWDEVANRCLSCTNCTMVCPTCFCTTTEDISDLDGEGAERHRLWDSCFSLDFSYLHGGSVRQSPKSRYRQWLTHKLASWHDQFGSSGCVGCGRCITWCPVGIDITEEARALREPVKANPD